MACTRLVHGLYMARTCGVHVLCMGGPRSRGNWPFSEDSLAFSTHGQGTLIRLSYPLYQSDTSPRPPWLRVDRSLGEWGIGWDQPGAGRQFGAVMEARRQAQTS